MRRAPDTLLRCTSAERFYPTGLCKYKTQKMINAKIKPCQKNHNNEIY